MPVLFCLLYVLFLFNACKTIEHSTKEVQTVQNFPFDHKKFQHHFELASWLYTYDRLVNFAHHRLQAQSSNSNLAPQNWLCYQNTEGKWFAIYRDLSQVPFETLAHYQFIKNSIDTADMVAPAQLEAYSSALAQTLLVSDSISKVTKTALNTYVETSSSNSSIRTWVLPAYEQNKLSTFGGEFAYTYDEKGEQLIRSSNNFDGFKHLELGILNELILDYKKYNTPTIGSLFYVACFAKSYESITIKTAQVASTMQWRDKENRKQMYWQHTLDF